MLQMRKVIYGALWVRYRAKKRADCTKQGTTMNQTEQMLREALRWYQEQSRLARLIHSEGDKGRHALANDGGEQAKQALAAEPAPLVRLTDEKIREIYASGPMTYIEFSNAIMDAMERVNGG